ncbi:MAG: ABC transporter permease [Deltaproteobacteria bacterium]|jgi:peptide/nickel transport system permease protein|nr:ABC transporter permease [Deltaproteobacteria bacterium]
MATNLTASGTEAGPGEPVAFKKQNNAKEIWRRFRKNRNAMVGLVLFAIVFLGCFVAPMFIPYSAVTKQNIRNKFASPSLAHVAGTDHFGRDELSRLLYGGRTTMAIGIVAAAMSLLVGGSLGMFAAYYDKLDNPIMRFIDILASIPPILMALAIVSALGTNLQNVVLAIATARMPAFCRVIRAAVLSVADQEYIEAARAGGTGDLRILAKHVLPNCLGTIIVQTTMNMSLLMLAAASLSFIGMGVQPPAPEWGAMLSEAREYMRQTTMLMILPGIGIVMVTTQLNLIGDGLRDAFDPRLKN